MGKTITAAKSEYRSKSKDIKVKVADETKSTSKVTPKRESKRESKQEPVKESKRSGPEVPPRTGKKETKKEPVKASKREKAEVTPRTRKSASKKEASKRPKRKDDTFLRIETSHTGDLKRVIEIVSNFISDCCIVFIPPDEVDGTEDDDFFEEIDENDYELKRKKSKRSYDSDEEDDDDAPAPKSKSKGTKRNTGGIRIIRLTEDKNILVKLKLDAFNFDKFYCGEPKITIGVDMHNLHAMLKMVSDDDPIMLYMNRNNSGSLYIRSIIDEGSEETDLEINLLELDNPEMPIRETEFQNKITIASDKFHTFCKQLHSISSTVEIRSINDEIRFRATGDGGKGSKVYRDPKYRRKKSKPDQLVQGVFDLRNLMGFSKCNRMCKNIEIYLKNDFPLVLVITVAALGKMYVFLTPLEDEHHQH
ncbi:Proliferating cell nuclear antigen [uncultured virus]|nr:Proliferating cell nuclear antigen [uncultured virus]